MGVFGAKHYAPGAICMVADCGRRPKARGLCQRHYRRWQRHGNPGVVLRDTSGFAPFGHWRGSFCSEGGCRSQPKARGLCDKHYDRQYRAVLAARPGYHEYMTAAHRKFRASPHGKAATHANNAKRRIHRSEGDATRRFMTFILIRADRCSICLGHLGPDRTIEHEMPLARGGRHDMANLQVAHARCNVSKSDRLPSEVWA